MIPYAQTDVSFYGNGTRRWKRTNFGILLHIGATKLEGIWLSHRQKNLLPFLVQCESFSRKQTRTTWNNQNKAYCVSRITKTHKDTYPLNVLLRLMQLAFRILIAPVMRSYPYEHNSTDNLKGLPVYLNGETHIPNGIDPLSDTVRLEEPRFSCRVWRRLSMYCLIEIIVMK